VPHPRLGPLQAASAPKQRGELRVVQPRCPRRAPHIRLVAQSAVGSPLQAAKPGVPNRARKEPLPLPFNCAIAAPCPTPASFRCKPRAHRNRAMSYESFNSSARAEPPRYDSPLTALFARRFKLRNRECRTEPGKSRCRCRSTARSVPRAPPPPRSAASRERTETARRAASRSTAVPAPSSPYSTRSSKRCWLAASSCETGSAEPSPDRAVAVAVELRDPCRVPHPRLVPLQAASAPKPRHELRVVQQQRPRRAPQIRLATHSAVGSKLRAARPGVVNRARTGRLRLRYNRAIAAPFPTPASVRCKPRAHRNSAASCESFNRGARAEPPRYDSPLTALLARRFKLRNRECRTEPGQGGCGCG
jgi:hypothetical protein